MIENIICMKQLSLLDIILNMLFVLTLILKLTTLDTSSKLHSLIKKDKRKVQECHKYKPEPLPDTKRKRKQTKPNKRKSNKRMKSTKISSVFPKQGNRNAKRTEKKHKNKITQGNT